MLGAGCTNGPVRSAPDQTYLAMPSRTDGEVVLAFDYSASMLDVCRRYLPCVTDLRWLRKGDSVFVKVACNSGLAHPAVTDPSAVEAIVAVLKEQGAARVFVGDQSGVEHVRFTPKLRVSSTRQRMAANGLLSAIQRSGAEAVFFDELGWDDFFQPRADFPHRWGNTVWLPNLLHRVDHIVNLPRIGAHAVAGYSAGIKNAVGWLRDDSRGSLHQRGDVFYERIAELNHFQPLRDKVRFTLTMGTKALVNIGPDMGADYDFEGVVFLGARRLIDHDQLVAALIPWLDKQSSSFFDVYSPYPNHVNYWNRGFVEDMWGAAVAADYRQLQPTPFELGPAHDAYLARLSVLQGYRPRKIHVIGPRETMPDGLVTFLARRPSRDFAI